MRKLCLVLLVMFLGLIIIEKVCTAEETNLQIEKRYVELINQKRKLYGLKSLEVDPLLTTVARDHSSDMRDKRYFAHCSPDGATPLDRYLHRLPYVPAYALYGENLFWCSSAKDSTPENGVQAFMLSPSHRDNVLCEGYESIGVGVTTDKSGQIWVSVELAIIDPKPSMAIVAKK
ncbi:TPA: hypothetical protein DD449_00960 [Candidatus Berkelbacteria bacterium]|uniref:SCP domain-containing protein n=1 Tax=Berkelbacteria bacterium GW2011_GWE1_39_12 TaxID=1618337 RepID=A0A0G4B6M5_9BACT|nr:MAG: hypothetical protein UT28_C0001G0895 [Berkelbacteria bacterium GW2011_GWE1_39_12]HBO60241.1 hypothetical protein [Candidatus Berkelbacteria bacterium]